jgi:hypothetical protein
VKEKKSQDDILEEIQSKENSTADIATHEEADVEGNKVQKLTYYEERQIKSVADFLEAQAAQIAEPEKIVVPDPEPAEEAEPVEEPIK